MPDQPEGVTEGQRARLPSGLLAGYEPLPSAYDEAFETDGTLRERARGVIERIDGLPRSEFRMRKDLAEEALLRNGVTFAVYSDERSGVERVFPFDLIPRIISAEDWAHLDAGLRQRIEALEAFLDDAYGERRCVSEGVIPDEMLEASTGYLREARGIRPPGGVRIHIAGIDIIQAPDGRYLVLEDNVRTPSGVSYVLENRAIMKRIFPKIFEEARVLPVDDYPLRLMSALGSLAPPENDGARVVILTPGPFNSAYFEHSFLARRMGCELVEGRDLFVSEDRVWVKTTHGPQRVDVIYRRIDDAFLDPEVFRADSLLGVPGLMRVYAKGNVTLANAPGNGVADDKAVYPFVPDFIRFFLDQDPILGQVETFICARPGECDHVLANLASLVVKTVDEAGGYGMLIGPQASKKELKDFAARIKANPRRYIAQPRIELSTSPTWTGTRTEPRRVDLRPYVVSGRSRWVLPGGLSRVALRKGSYVVNSSQGGGSKDTWVLSETDLGPKDGGP
ncbi:MAG TPA: circularly permuted type 2 ATP-grasp protein [Longimicrobiales bacterium]|nr:circularly permuted type 2 ATP-grasp protein [Longimicrobiales bacterium]